MTAFKTNGKVLTLTVGIPASGKTFWALQAGFDVCICLDDCRKELWESPEVQDGPGGVGALLALEQKKIKQALEAGKSIVVHNTHPLKEYRVPVIQMGRDVGYQVQIVYFDVSPDECKNRNRERPNAVPEDVMDDYEKSLEIPEPEEADVVIRFSEIVRR